MKAYIIFINLFFCVTLGFSQSYLDLLRINVGLSPENQFDSSSVTSNLKETQVDLTIPVKVNTGSSILTGVIYENIQTKLFTEGIIKKFGSITCKVGINKRVNDHWSTTVLLLPKMASDFNSVQSNDFQMGALALFKYKKRDNLNYRLGLYYNSELFGPFFVPMLGLYYQSPDRKFETSMVLPLQADVNYQLINFINVGCNFSGQIRTYHLNNVSSVNPNTYVTKSTNDFFAYLKFNITNGVSLQTKVGHSLSRSYRVYDGNDKVTFGLPATFIGDQRHQLNTDFSDGIIYQIVLLYRLNL